MKIAIVGAGGLLGSAFARTLSQLHEVLALYHDEVEVTNASSVHAAITNARPDLILNCAVLGVDACEIDPHKADDVNVAGAENVARAADAVGAELIHFSSNYVFDGTKAHGSYYVNDDEPNPLSVYGRTKLAGENAATSSCERCFVARTSWVFGLGKASFFGMLPQQLRANRRVRAIRDMWASPTYINDLVTRVMEIVSHGHFAIYHVVNDGVCSYHDFALETARVAGLSQSRIMELIEPVNVDDMDFRAARPRYTPMKCKVSEQLGLASLRDWRAAVTDYVHDMH